ncbi:hypothetical protein GCM10022393_36050 [Aquimarina addita]|uniref:PH domain-containing protein n=1 Tax=Aquimarina addita TaxID=870485 RepID=A0ABP6UUZ4_9FLAO
MKKYSKFNATTRGGFVISLFFTIPGFFFILLAVFSDDIQFKLEVFMLFLPSIVYILYVFLINKFFYEAQVSKKLKLLEKYELIVDEMISDTVKIGRLSTFGSTTSTIEEYYFIFYNKEYDKFIRVSLLGVAPKYKDVILKSWENLPITIFIDPKELNNPKKGKSKKKVDRHTLRTFRFYRGSYHLENNYEYSISEYFDSKNIFLGILFMYSFMIVCVYLFGFLVKTYLH